MSLFQKSLKFENFKNGTKFLILLSIFDYRYLIGVLDESPLFRVFQKGQGNWKKARL